MALRNFDPAAFMANWSDEKYLPTHNGKTFEESIRAAFSIPKNDMYVYRAQGETTLAITQRAINGKRANGLHNWYHDEEGKPVSGTTCPLPYNQFLFGLMPVLLIQNHILSLPI